MSSSLAPVAALAVGLVDGGGDGYKRCKYCNRLFLPGVPKQDYCCHTHQQRASAVRQRTVRQKERARVAA